MLEMKQKVILNSTDLYWYIYWVYGCNDTVNTVICRSHYHAVMNHTGWMIFTSDLKQQWLASVDTDIYGFKRGILEETV